ncbi:MAG: redoxin domain-containing protein [Armatimonadetes bacterium]|nr:redoxin domain-containing protein [Armatimonadota bacterium]MDE2207325.1 redoxin domain-containing protein [Armatimonadota bacterium]
MTIWPDEPLAPGAFAPDFTLPDMMGKEYSSASARADGLLLLLLYKTGCGSSRFSLPFYQRFAPLCDASRGRLAVWAIVQDTAEIAAPVVADAGLTCPVLLDPDCTTTAAWGIQRVPNLYLVAPDSTILAAVTGHLSGDGWNEVARKASEFLGLDSMAVVSPADGVVFKPG